MEPKLVQMNRQRLLDDFKVHKDVRWSNRAMVVACIKHTDAPGSLKVGGGWHVFVFETIGM